MNELLPYEEELSKQLSDLPLPDENTSWEDMKRRLEDDNDDGIIIPPAGRGCIGYGLLLMLLAVVIGLIVRQDEWLRNKNKKKIASAEKVFKKINPAVTNKNGTADHEKNSVRPRTPATPGKGSGSLAKNNKGYLVTKDSIQSHPKKKPNQKIINRANDSIDKYLQYRKTYRNKPVQERSFNNYTNRNRHIKKTHKETTGKLLNEISGNGPYADSLKNFKKNKTRDKEPTSPGDSLHSRSRSDSLHIDSITKKIIDSNAVKKINNIDSTHKIAHHDSTAKRLIYFTAGAALNQQLPVNGQKLVPYNSLGRKGTAGDYIPSVYFRMYKDQKWFLQSEFRYGAPQYTKEILYAQKKVVDSSSGTTLSTSNRLKKTYYHQLPASFNYFVLPHFSIGLGFTWNKFSSAVSEQQVVLTNNATQIDSFQSKTIFHSKKPDSNFVKSYFQALAEMQYQWKRWSFGGRYSFGLQPYLKFQLPGGELHKEKNSSVQLFVRYELWQPKKK